MEEIEDFQPEGFGKLAENLSLDNDNETLQLSHIPINKKQNIEDVDEEEDKNCDIHGFKSTIAWF